MSEFKITPKQKADITRSVNTLNRVRDALQKANPDCEVNWYLEATANLNLMSGHSHKDDAWGSPNHEAVEGCWRFEQASGGGW